MKVIKSNCSSDDEYVGGTYEAFKLDDGDGKPDYITQVNSNTTHYFEWDQVEEINEPLRAKITMTDIMRSLGIEQEDIVRVSANGVKYCLRLNDESDLVHIDGRYDGKIPNIILGMVSGKHDYVVYSVKETHFTDERR